MCGHIISKSKCVCLYVMSMGPPPMASGGRSGTHSLFLSSRKSGVPSEHLISDKGLSLTRIEALSLESDILRPLHPLNESGNGSPVIITMAQTPVASSVRAVSDSLPLPVQAAEYIV